MSSVNDPFVDQSRLIDIDDCRESFPDLGFSGHRSIRLQRGELLAIDPIYLADIYNPNDDPLARYVRTHAVILADFGGDGSAAILWASPYLMMPLSLHLPEDFVPPVEAEVLYEELGWDSGSLAFLPLAGAPQEVIKAAKAGVDSGDAALLSLNPGEYTFFYEQFDAPAPNERGLYRNIVARLS